MSQAPSTDKGQFVQFPVHLIYERKDLNRDDKWVLLAIMGMYWTPGPHKLSYREISTISEVSLSLLASYDEKKTGKHHEGIIDRLVRFGDITICKDKERNPVTGKPKGQEQTYIVINYDRIWNQNKEYCDSRKSVPHANDSVSHANASVPGTNTSVSDTNDSVSDLRSEIAPIYYIDNTDTEDKEERESLPAHSDASASAHTPSESSEQKLQQIIEDKTANGVGSPPAPSKDANNGQEVIHANVPGTQKRPRRPKPEIDAPTQKRIDLVVEALNGMKQEVTGDPEAHYFVFQKDTEAIVEKLLPQSPTPKKLRRVFLDMWNEKDRNGNYFWRKRMKIHNICNEYESRMMGLEGKTPTPSNSDGPSALVAAGYTNNHTPKAGEPLIKFKPLVRRT